MKEKYSILRSADRFIEQRQYKKAIKVYQSLIDSGEKDPSIINSLGDLQYRDGDSSAALKSYFRAASAFAESGDAMKAVGLCRKILRSDPSDDEALELFLDLNGRRDAVFESIGLLRDMVRDHVETLNFTRAVNLQEKLVNIEPENASARLLLAELQFRIDKKDESTESVYKTADLVSSDNAVPEKWERLMELLAAGDCKEGFQQFVQGLKADYDPAGTETAGKAAVEVDEIPVPADTVDKESREDTLISPELFEVDSAISDGEALEESMEQGVEEAFDFQTQEKAPPTPPEMPEETVVDSPATPPDFPEKAEEEESGQSEEPEKFAEALPEEPLPEEAAPEDEAGQEFELNLDEDDFSESPEKILEMLEEESAGESLLDADVEIKVDEPGEEYSVSLDEVADGLSSGEIVEELLGETEKEADGAEALDYEAMGVEDLGEPGTGEESRDFDVDESVEISEEMIPEDLDLEISASSEIIPSGSDEETAGGFEIESALESIFVADDAGEQPVPSDVPEGVAEKEYIGSDRSEPVSSDESPVDPDEDPEVQLELGIAYRDMALLEDAIVKYENALEMFEVRGDKDKCVRCCQLLAEGFNEQEQFEETLRWVNRGLDYQDLSGDEIVSFEYESAVALEALGDFSESLKSYRRIQSIHPGFRDVENRISAMESTEH